MQATKHPVCPTVLKDGSICAAPLRVLNWQLWIDGKQIRWHSFWGCYRCTAAYHLDLSPALPVPREEWADDKIMRGDDYTKAQARREHRIARIRNRETEEYNKQVKKRDNDKRTHLLRLYQQGTPHCQQCGETDLAVLQRHHLDGNVRNNKPDNIIILCANDHWRRTMPKKSKRYQNPKALL